MNVDFDWLTEGAELLEETPVLKDGVHEFEFKRIEAKETQSGTKIVELTFREVASGIYVSDSLWFNEKGIRIADAKRRKYSLTFAGKENVSIKELDHQAIGKKILLKVKRDLARERYYLNFPTKDEVYNPPQNQTLKTSNPGSTDDLPF